MRLDVFLHGIAIFSFIVVIGVFMFNGVVDSYDLNTTSEDVGFTDVYDVSNDLFSDGEDIKEDILRADVEGGDETEDSLIKGAFKATKTAAGSFSLVSTIMSAVTKTLHLPPFFQTFLTTIIMIGIIFGVVYLVRGIFA